MASLRGSYSLISLTWLKLEVADGVVHIPFSSEYFNRLEVYPQVIEQILTAVEVLLERSASEFRSCTQGSTVVSQKSWALGS